jgi:hypothetical protein
MNLKKHALLIAFAATSALPMSASIVSAQVNDRQSATSEGHARTIQGVWRTVVTPQDCQTGVPITSLPGLFTFNEDGTMSEYGIRPPSSPACVVPATECGSVNTAGKPTRSLSFTTVTTPAAFASDRRKSRLV